jgi:hypothetical protein
MLPQFSRESRSELVAKDKEILRLKRQNDLLERAAGEVEGGALAEARSQVPLPKRGGNESMTVVRSATG